MAIRFPEGSAEFSASHQRAVAFRACPPRARAYLHRIAVLGDRLQETGGLLRAALGTVCREFLSLF